jgi:hypothetical protein
MCISRHGLVSCERRKVNGHTLPAAPIGIFIEADQRWKQLQSEKQQQKQKFYGLSPLSSPKPSIKTIQQLGLGISSSCLQHPPHQYLKKLVYSPISHAFDHTIIFYPVTKLSVYC